MKNALNTIQARITRSSSHKQEILSQEMNSAPRTVSWILREDLGLQAYTRYIRQLLNTHLRHLQLGRLKKLLRIYSKNVFKKILSTDEKNFTKEQ